MCLFQCTLTSFLFTSVSNGNACLQTQNVVETNQCPSLTFIKSLQCHWELDVAVPSYAIYSLVQQLQVFWGAPCCPSAGPQADSAVCAAVKSWGRWHSWLQSLWVLSAFALLQPGFYCTHRRVCMFAQLHTQLYAQGFSQRGCMHVHASAQC